MIIRCLFEEEPYGLIGKIPKDIIETLEWVRNQGKIDDDNLNNLKLRVFEKAYPQIYWEASQEILKKMKRSQSDESAPMDFRKIDRREQEISLLTELKKLVPLESFYHPIGKDCVRRGNKRDDLSKKNYPVVRNSMAILYNLLLPFYPKPQLKTFGREKEAGPQQYSTEVARDIVTLLKAEFPQHLKDLEERDIFSVWKNKSRNRI